MFPFPTLFNTGCYQQWSSTLGLLLLSTMLEFVDTPEDVLLRILYILEVKDILCMEMVSKTLHAFLTLDARHLWLVKLNELDHTCAPDISPHVDIDDLSCGQLRNIVVRAVRVHCSMLKGPEPTATYVLRKTIIPTRPKTSSNEEQFTTHFVKIAPGGRYVSMCFSSRCHTNTRRCDKELRILDTENDNRCVWTLDLSHGHQNADAIYIYDYEFHVRRDGSIILAALTCCRGERNSVAVLSQVFRLSPDSAIGSFKESILYSISSRGRYYYPAGSNFAIYGDLVVLFECSNRLITILNCEEGRIVKIRYSTSDSLSHFRIWGKHLFYIDNQRAKLRAIPLVQILESSEEQSVLTPNQEIEQLYGTCYKFDKVAAEEGNSGMITDTYRTRCSIYDAPWKNDSQAVFTIIGQTGTHFPHFVTMRVRFHLNGSGDWMWTSLGAKMSRYHDANFKIHARSQLTRSGRYLTSAWRTDTAQGVLVMGGLLQPDPGLAAVDREGGVLLPRLSSNITQLKGKASKEKKSGSDGPKYNLEDYLEEYSGALVLLKDEWAEGNCVEIYYPE